MKKTHTASQPAASNERVSVRTCSKSTGVCSVPSASTRSSTSRRRSRGTTGRKLPRRPQVCGRSRRRISSTSRKPRGGMMAGGGGGGGKKGEKRATEARGLRTVPAAHLQHVAETARGDDAGARHFALQQRVGADRGAVHDGGDG